MLYVLICQDRPNSLDLRSNKRLEHLAYVEQKSVIAAGPFLDEQERMVGSLIILDVPSKAHAEVFSANDPYAKAGLFLSIEIKPWRWAINPPKG